MSLHNSSNRTNCEIWGKLKKRKISETSIAKNQLTGTNIKFSSSLSALRKWACRQCHIRHFMNEGNNNGNRFYEKREKRSIGI